MTELFSLGELYPSDFIKDGDPLPEKVEMKLIMDDDGLVRLEKTAPLNSMYGKYWYRSGINSTMKEALKDVVDSILKSQKLNSRDVWLDIACNDGTLLSFVPEEIYRIGIDPAEDSYKNEALYHCNTHCQSFFSKDNYNTAITKKAKVVTSIAMFYDVPNPKQFISDVFDILEDDGLWVMQLSYSPLMIRQMAFDNICHEHIYYYNLLDLNKLLGESGFHIKDVELNDVNGGSIRLYINKTKFGLYNTIGSVKVNSLLEWEMKEGMNYDVTWDDFFEEIEQLKAKTMSFIYQVKSEGRSIWAYGASTKGNTLLQYFGLDNTMIDAIAERHEGKWGLKTIGSNIPIKSEQEMRDAKPDYLLILPWHFLEEFKTRESDYLKNGGKFIVPCPEFKVIGYDSI